MDGSRVDTKGFTSVQMVHTHTQLFHSFSRTTLSHTALSRTQLSLTHTRNFVTHTHNSFTHTHNFIMVFLRGSRSIWSRPRSLSVAVTGELLGDIHAWFPQHRHTLQGVASVALGDIHAHFLRQAWPAAEFGDLKADFLWAALLALVVRLVPRGRLWTWRQWAGLGGVLGSRRRRATLPHRALRDIHAHLVWWVWHLLRWAGSGRPWFHARAW